MLTLRGCTDGHLTSFVSHLGREVRRWLDVVMHESTIKTRRALGRVRYLRQRCSDAAVNITILKPRLTAAAETYMWDFADKIMHSSVYTISEKANRFQHPDYNADRAQKLISSSMSRHLSTHSISSKSMLALWVILHRQTNTGKRISTKKWIMFI